MHSDGSKPAKMIAVLGKLCRHVKTSIGVMRKAEKTRVLLLQANKAKNWAERIGDLLLDAVDPVAAAAHSAVAAVLESTLANAGTPGAARWGHPSP